MLGEVDDTLTLYLEALKISKEVGDRSGMAATLNNISSVYHRTGQP